MFALKRHLYPLQKISYAPFEGRDAPRAEALYNNAATSAKQESRDLVATGGAGFAPWEQIVSF